LAAIGGRVRAGTTAGIWLRSASAPIDWGRVWTIVACFAAVLVAAITVDRYLYAATYLNPGVDYDTLMGATHRFLAGGGFYNADQLAGPWIYHQGEPAFAAPIMYPPDALFLFVPFAYLPGFLWWAGPVAIVGWALWRLRPHPAAWLAIVLLLGVPQSREGIIWGNPVMWMVAFEAAGFVIGWAGVLVLLKPTLAPFALAGFPRRRWLLALALLCVSNLALLPMWADWLTVLRYSSNLGPGFSLYQFPLMAVPLVAWLGSRHGPLLRLRRGEAPAR
jgi:hypothetical protein